MARRHPYKCGLCYVGEHCNGDSNNAECECTCTQEDEDGGNE